jgi:hypothetical protein
MSAPHRLCGTTRKMTGRENLDFARRTSSAQVIVQEEAHGRATRGKIARATEEALPNCPSRPSVAVQIVIDAEKTSFSAQSVGSSRPPSRSISHSSTDWWTRSNRDKSIKWTRGVGLIRLGGSIAKSGAEKDVAFRRTKRPSIPERLWREPSLQSPACRAPLAEMLRRY